MRNKNYKLTFFSKSDKDLRRKHSYSNRNVWYILAFPARRSMNTISEEHDNRDGPGLLFWQQASASVELYVCYLRLSYTEVCC